MRVYLGKDLVVDILKNDNWSQRFKKILEYADQNPNIRYRHEESKKQPNRDRKYMNRSMDESMIVEKVVKECYCTRRYLIDMGEHLEESLQVELKPIISNEQNRSLEAMREKWSKVNLLSVPQLEDTYIILSTCFNQIKHNETGEVGQHYNLIRDQVLMRGEFSAAIRNQLNVVQLKNMVINLFESIDEAYDRKHRLHCFAITDEIDKL